MIEIIKDIVGGFNTVSLSEMDEVTLMDRYDTKYLLPVNRIPELLKMMDGHYRVLEVKETRVCGYNTTYLDTPDYLFFYQHITRREQRLKIRYRNYLSTGVTFLEIKRKDRKQKTVKVRIESSVNGNIPDIKELEFLNGHVSIDTAVLRPVISNTFKRITFVRFDIPERITLDLDLSFSSADGRSKNLPLVAIAELKSQGLAVRSPFSKLIRSLSVFPTGFSKYCTGLVMVHDDVPRKNVLKPKILLLNKIENGYNGSLSA